MVEATRDMIYFQAAPGLPFYSQVLCSAHRNGPNSTDSKDLPRGRTLFLKSLDPLITKTNICNGLSSLGNVRVTPASKAPQSGDGSINKTGLYHAIFEDSKVLKKVVGSQGKCIHTVIPAKAHVSKHEGTFLMSALERLRASYRGMDILQKNADECLTEYDLAAEIQRRLDQEVTVDDEGFTLVTTGPEAVKCANHRTVKRQRESPTTTINFYRFPNKQAVIASMQNEPSSNKPE